MGQTLLDLGLTPTFGPDVRVSGFSLDSRTVKSGDLFGAFSGTLTHGASYAQSVIASGAAAILTDQKGLEILTTAGLEQAVSVIVTEDARATFARAAALFYPHKPAVIAAVTGTNGKTSVATFLRQIWAHLGYEAINLGTTGMEGAVQRPLAHTTPDTLTLLDALAQAAEAGVTHCAMEASSHGLDQGRLDGLDLRAGGFTNLSQDHLDYHNTFEAYFDAKAGLFTRVMPVDRPVVINIDDPYGVQLKERCAARAMPVITVGHDMMSDLHIQGQRYDATGQTVLFSYAGTRYQKRLPLVGGFQAHNALVAAGLALATGEPADEVFGALEHLNGVRGRMELAATRDNGGAVFVDYAHTPDAVSTAITALRPHVMGRVVAIIGAGGDRDRSKRPLMGAAAAQAADIVIITDDNPRSEDPDTIRAAVAEGAPEAMVVGDRAEAILRGVDLVGAGDALIICGKGHETTQIVGDVTYPFDDVEQASVAVAALEGRL
jgi:UDP-N-acetylmuramoyl-L-alanyl-D-glutamate--2,6-diaminopimelate ligase